jgi:hypothetical protein
MKLVDLKAVLKNAVEQGRKILRNEESAAPVFTVAAPTQAATKAPETAENKPPELSPQRILPNHDRLDTYIAAQCENLRRANIFKRERKLG